MGMRLSRAERRQQTQEELVTAAETCFIGRGFHDTSVDEIAERAGYTKGAVYSNFASKEDLFLAVYQRRVERVLTNVVPGLREAGAERALDWLATVTIQRRDSEDGWLAVFFEFWAHVLRNPPLRERFEALHRAGRQPFVEAADRLGLPVDTERWTLALTAMVTGLSLEQLTDPSLDAGELAAQMMEMLIKGAQG